MVLKKISTFSQKIVKNIFVKFKAKRVKIQERVKIHVLGQEFELFFVRSLNKILSWMEESNKFENSLVLIKRVKIRF